MSRQNKVEIPNALVSEETKVALETLFSRRDELDELELLERREKRAQIEAEREIAKRARETRIETLRRETENRDRNQELCQHRLERGDTALVGQFSSTGVLILSCQICQKQYIGRENVPPGLMPPQERLGYVQVG